MADEIVYPFNGKVGAALNSDASHAILKIGFNDGTLNIGLTPDMIDVLVSKLEKVAMAAEQQRRKADPFAGKDGDRVMRSAFIVTQYGVGTLEGVDGVAISLHRDGPPSTYLLDYAQSEDLAQRILDVLRGRGPQPPARN